MAKYFFDLDGIQVGENHRFRHEPVSCVAQLPVGDNDDDVDDDDADDDDVAQLPENTIMKLVVGIERGS